MPCLQLPLEDARHAYEEAVAIKPSSCLEEGWQFPGEIEDKTQGKTEDKTKCVKVNTFLASKGRINDEPRMVKVKPLESGRYEKGYFSSLERERMLGFPEGYVQGAVEHLFDRLLRDALDLHFPLDNKNLWKNQLEAKYFCFSGEPVRYEEAYNEEDESPIVGILMSPPQVTKSVSSLSNLSL